MWKQNVETFDGSRHYAVKKNQAKKYNGILEYYRKGNPNEVVAYYASYRGLDGKPTKEKLHALTLGDALIELLQKKNEIKRFKESNGVNAISINNGTATLDEYAEQFFSERITINNQKDKNKYY